MPMPVEYQRATDHFHQFLADARDEANFGSVHQASVSSEGSNWVRGVVLYAGKDVIPFAANLHAVPLSRLWSH